MGLGQDSAVRQLMRLSDNSDPELHNELMAVLKNPYLPAIEFDEAEAACTRVRPTDHRLLLGGLQFLLFGRDLDLAARAEARVGDAYRRQANERLQLDYAREFIFNEYGIPDAHRGHTITLLEVGTTSYILRIFPSEHVLKIIKPRYLDNPTIAQYTEVYDKQFVPYRHPQTPHVFATGKRFIIMEFVRGMTLRRYVDERIRSQHVPRLPAVTHILHRLCRILRDYAEHGIYHYDLSPDNIIVDDQDNNIDSILVSLIDFGHNYILIERIGSAMDFANIAPYVPKELLEGTSERSALTDIFSLGAILTDMLSPTAVAPSQLHSALDEIVSQYPGLGSLLESMLDPNPRTRIFELTTMSETEQEARRPSLEQGAGLYTRLIRELDSRFEMIMQIHARTEVPWYEKVVQWAEPIVASPGLMLVRVRELLFYRHQQRWGEAHAARRLVFYFGAAQFAHLIVAAAIIGYLLVPTWMSSDYQRLLFAGPAWIVGFSASLLAAKYYTNIFAGVSLVGLSTRGEFWMRANSFCFAPPILFAVVLYPITWPLCTALGLAFVTLNNHAVYRYCASAKRRINTTLGIGLPRSAEDFLSEYRGWWEVTAIYAGSLVLLGILMLLGRVQDLWVYAIVVALIMNGKMYWYNCGQAAPRIRGGIARIVGLDDRARRYEAWHTQEVRQVAGTGQPVLNLPGN